MKNILPLIFALAVGGVQAQSVSGSWYNPAQSGHGLAVDQLSPDSALLLWFTYDALGEPMPIYAEAAREGDAFRGAAYAPYGPRFGDWDPAELQFEPWGSLAFNATSCETGELRWNSPAFGQGSTPMRLLAYTAASACPHAARPASALGGLSGTWYHSQLQGASVNVQVVDDGAALAYWYTYDGAGRPKPLYIEGTFDGRRLAGDALAPEGMRFGGFRRQDLRVEDFGEVSIEFHDCRHATLGYDTPYGRGTLPLVRLTSLEGLGCALPDAVPAGLPRHFSGHHHSLFASLPASAMVTSRDEVLLWMDGKVRRGFFTPAPDAEAVRLVFDDGAPGTLARDSGGRLEGTVGFGATGRRVVLDDIDVVTDGLAAALRGGWAQATTSPIEQLGRNLTIADDGTVAYRANASAHGLLATGRIGRIDESLGSFDFDLRFEPAQGGHRVIGSGRVRRSASGESRIELFGSGPAGASLYVSLPRL